MRNLLPCLAGEPLPTRVWEVRRNRVHQVQRVEDRPQPGSWRRRAIQPDTSR